MLVNVNAPSQMFDRVLYTLTFVAEFEQIFPIWKEIYGILSKVWSVSRKQQISNITLFFLKNKLDKNNEIG